MSFGSSNQTSYGATNPRYGISRTNEMHPPVNFSEGGDFRQLCDNVSSNIFAVNNSASTLEKALKQVGTSNDSLNLRDKIHDTQQITNSTISSTTRSLRVIATYASRGDRQQKLHLDRIRNEFQETVKRYSDLQKKVAEKIKLHYLSAKPRTGSAGVAWNDAVEDDINEDKQQLLVQEQRQAEIQAQQLEIEYDAAMIAEREAAVRQIEADILDVNQIFRDLGSMVHEQGEMINSIEGNIETASHEVRGGKDHLDKASHYQKSYRKKLCCILIFLLIVVAIIVIVVLTQVNKK